MPSHDVSYVIGIFGILASIGTFFLGRYFGKKESKEYVNTIIDKIVKAINIKYLVDGEDDKALHFDEKTGKISGIRALKAESSHPVTIKDPKTGKVLTEHEDMEQNSKLNTTKKFDWL